MKIEKLNENQIRCVLTKEDLDARHIKISELAYGSEKAKSLFREMVQQACSEYGFEVDDMPLMVEAIPAATGNLVLLISKVEYPDELDARFSKFSDPDEEYLEDQDPISELLSKQGASDILDLFREMKNEMDKPEADKDTPSDPAVEKQTDKTDHAADDISEDKEKTEVSGEKKKEAGKPKLKADADLISVFEFENMETIEQLAAVLNGFYQGRNDIYREQKKNSYYLLMHKNKHTPEQFNRICNISSEFGRQIPYIPALGAFLEEHTERICRNDALQTLAGL